MRIVAPTQKAVALESPSTVQYSTESTVQYSTESTVQYSTVHSTVKEKALFMQYTTVHTSALGLFNMYSIFTTLIPFYRVYEVH